MPQRFGGGGATQQCALCASRPAIVGARDGSCGQACSECLRTLGGPFAITNPASNLVLETDAHEPGKLQVWLYNGRPNQLWQYDLSTREIVNSSTGQALDLDAADKTSMITWDKNGRPNQQWIIDPNSLTITNLQTGRAVGIVGDGHGELREGAPCVALPLTRHGGPHPDQVWTLQSATSGAASVDGGGGSAAHPPEGVPPFDGTAVMVLTDNDGQRVCFEAVSQPIEVHDFKGKKGVALKLQYPIFFCPSARLAKAQHKAQPVLFMTNHDWEYLRQPHVTHSGAFGSDEERWPATLFEQRFDAAASTFQSPPRSDWRVVWKFPGDLNGIPTFRRIENIPLPVGFYNFQDDGW